jgi:hypothetical protein
MLATEAVFTTQPTIRMARATGRAARSIATSKLTPAINHRIVLKLN